MSAPSFLQLQTQAAHPPKRFQNQPDKNTQVTISFSSSSTSTTQASSPRSSIESSPSQSPFTDWARCSRCHRSVTVDGSLPSMPGVSFGTNSYYCQRCAKVVGFLSWDDSKQHDLNDSLCAISASNDFSLWKIRNDTHGPICLYSLDESPRPIGRGPAEWGEHHAWWWSARLTSCIRLLQRVVPHMWRKGGETMMDWITGIGYEHQFNHGELKSPLPWARYAKANKSLPSSVCDIRTAAGL